MKKFISWIAFFTIAFLPLQAQNLLIGYYPSWSQNVFTAGNVQWAHVTHVVHAFVWPLADGSLGYESGFWYGELTRLAHQNERKVLISVGGAGQSGNFSTVAADAVKRARLVSDLVSAVQQHNYDGVDIDWEFPESETDKNNMVGFIADLHKALNDANPDYLLTMAIPSGKYYGQWFRYDVLKLYVNWFNVMTYDYHGDWFDHSGHNAPLYSSAQDGCGSVDETCKYLNEIRGVEQNKMCIGLAFYGRKFNTSALYQSSTGGDQTFGYKDIIGTIGNGWIYHWDDVSKVPYLTNDAGTQLLSYDDTTAIRIKSNYIVEKSFKGGMIWALGLDQTDGNRQPLLETAANILSINFLQGSDEEPIIPNQINLRAYPNPFNNKVMLRYRIPENQDASIKLFDSQGKLITVLLQGSNNLSESKLSWSAEGYSSGVFFAILQTQSGQSVQKLIHLK